MKSLRMVGARRGRLAVCGAVAVFASAFVAVAPAGAGEYGHPKTPVTRGVTPAVGGAIDISDTSLTFPAQRAGTYSGDGQTVTLTNSGIAAVVFDEIFSTTLDYFGTTTCFNAPSLAIGESCTITTFFLPIKSGTRSATLEIDDDADNSPQTVSLSGQGVEGYFLAGAHGGVAHFGDAVDHGDATALSLSAPIISIKTTANGAGYWLLGSDGGVFSYGNAKFHGSTGGIHLNQPVVGMERTLDGEGYWLVASDGGIFSFGTAKFYGSTGAIHLNQPVVGMAATPTGKGYWLVARDGGIFSFGDAKFFGSTGNIRLNQPITGMVARPSAKGYWMHASDGGVFAFGDAPFFGSSVGSASGTTTGMAATPDGGGYWLASNTGAVHHYGNAAALGDLPSLRIAVNDVVGIAATSPAVPLDFLP